MRTPEIKRVGLWIDHAHAYLIHLEKTGGMTMRCLESEVEPKHKTKGGSVGNPKSRQVGGASHKKPQERRLNQLHDFYQEVVRAVSGADQLAVFGPGLAKHEFLKEFGKVKAMAGRVVGVVTAEKMTDNQLKAMIRDYFR